MNAFGVGPGVGATTTPGVGGPINSPGVGPGVGAPEMHNSSARMKNTPTLKNILILWAERFGSCLVT